MAETARENVVRLEDVLKDGTNTATTPNATVKKKKKKNNKKAEKEGANAIPKGRRKSGRVWRSERDKPSNMIKTRGIKKANKYEKLMKLKAELKRVRLLTKDVVDARNEEIEQKKERRRKNLKRAEEKRLKSDIVQHITNPAKIKRMKKKHLRTIEKRDTLNMKK